MYTFKKLNIYLRDKIKIKRFKVGGQFIVV